MAKFKCTCGYLFVLQSEAAPEEYSLVLERTLVDIAELVDKKNIDFDSFYELIDRSRRDILLCPTCHRVWISGRKDGHPTNRMYSFVWEDRENAPSGTGPFSLEEEMETESDVD